MRILFLSHAQYITVALPKIIELAEQLVFMGHHVTLVATSKTNKFKLERVSKNGVDFILSPSILWGKLRHGADLWDVIRRCYHLFKNRDFDIIHCIDSRPTVILPALLLKYFRKIPLIIEWSDLYSQGGTISERSSIIYQYTFGKIEEYFETSYRKYADGATVITKFLKNHLIKLGFDEEKILLHRMGCVVDRNKIVDKQFARAKLGLDKNKIYICHLGRIHGRDLKLLLDSFAVVQSKYDDIELILIGSIGDREKIEADNIRYLGFVNTQLYPYYCSAIDFFVMPLKQSKTNLARWPSKIGDYLSFAKPIVSTRVSDFENIFNEDNVGTLAGNDSAESFGNAMLKMIEGKDNWRTWGSNSFNYALNNLDWNIISNRLVDFYKMIIRSN